MSESVFTESDMNYGTLGAHYGFAKRVSERAMEAFKDEHMSPLIDEFGKQFAEKLWDTVRDSLWADTEMNLQGQMWQAVDEIIKGVLSGQRWITDRWVLGSRYDCEAVRKAVAAHFGPDVATARIADLEAEVASLKEQLKWARS